MPRDIHALITPIRASLASSGLAVVDEDIGRPWGGFLAISPHDIQRFTGAYFAEAAIQLDERSVGLSPKILLVAPGRRLSWQYHCRRSEIWRIIQGTVAISRGPNDEEPPPSTYRPGDVVRIALGERHRLAGLEDWGVIAEIWQHTDIASPSDEQDIVRVADDDQRI